MPEARPPRKAIALLAVLYFAQGLPFGIQATALPVVLRQHGASLAQIGFAGILALPWLLKMLWAPWVDRHGSHQAWIGAMQGVLATVAFGTAYVAGGAEPHLPVLAGSILLMNFAAATQDIAVDGLAVQVLGRAGLGWGNAAQVVGYKLGMLTGGGVLVWLSDSIGWRGVFLAMAGLFAFSFALFHVLSPGTMPAARSSQHASVAAVFALVLRALAVPGAGAVLCIIGFYKFGESMVTAMFKPFLVDRGFTAGQIGLWVGTWGMVASLAGSLCGGGLVESLGSARTLRLAAWWRVAGLAVEWAVAAWWPTDNGIILATCIEHAVGGVLTTALFAWMMARVDSRIGASHYTVFAGIEVFGKMPAAWLSGFGAQGLGYLGLFAAGVLLSVGYALALPALVRRAGLPPSTHAAIGASAAG